MAKPPLKVCVLIPAYNEEKRVGAVVREVREYCPDVVVIDDGSPDDTDKVAAEAGATVLEHVYN